MSRYPFPPKRSKFKKLTALSLSFAIFFQAGLVPAAEGRFWQDRAEGRRKEFARLPASARAPGPPPFSALLSSPSKIPASLGPLPDANTRALAAAVIGPHAQIRRYLPPIGRPSRGTIVHVMDVHLNSEAQENIGRLLGAAARTSILDVVALEGAFGPLPLERYRRYRFPDSLRKASDYLLRHHRISGPVHAALTQPLPPVVGVDDRIAYRANVDAYLASRATRFEADRTLSSERDDLDRRRDRLSAPLREFDLAAEAFHAERLPLSSYLRRFPARDRALDRFLAAHEAERTLDASRVEAERRALLERLGVQASDAEIRPLLDAALAVATGDASPAAFYDELRSLMKRRGFSLASTPALAAYVSYLELAESLDAEAVLRSLAACERRAYETLARTDEERRYGEDVRRHRLTRKLVAFELSPDEWARFKEGPIGVRGEKHNLDADQPLGPYAEFYRAAERRDRLMAENLLREMESRDADAAVLVAGGFHAGVADRLRRHGFGVLQTIPRLTRVDGGSGYLTAFLRQKSPLERMFDGEKLFVPPSPVAGAPLSFVYATGLEKWRDPSVPETEVIREIDSGVSDVEASVDGNEVRLEVARLDEDPVQATLTVNPSDGTLLKAVSSPARSERPIPLFILDPFVRWMVAQGGLLLPVYLALILVAGPLIETQIFQTLFFNSMFPAGVAAASPDLRAVFVLVTAVVFGIAHIAAFLLARALLPPSLRPPADQADEFIFTPLPGAFLSGLYLVLAVSVGEGWAFALTALAHSALQFAVVRRVLRPWYEQRVYPWWIERATEWRAMRGRWQVRTAAFQRKLDRAGTALMTVALLIWLGLRLPASELVRRFVPDPPRLTYLGGAGEMGANATLVEVDGKKVLVDAGGMMGRSAQAHPWIEKIPADLDAIVVTHAHADHIGSLPLVVRKLTRAGRSVPIYASPETIRLMHTMLPSSLRDLRRFGVERSDVSEVLRAAIPIETGVRLSLGPRSWVRLHAAGHLIGARSAEIGTWRGVALVTGDISIQPQFTVGGAEFSDDPPDLLVTESTYGYADAADRNAEVDRFIDSIVDTIARGGHVIIPTLAMGRSGEVLFALQKAMESGRIPPETLVHFDGSIRDVNQALIDIADHLPDPLRDRIRTTGHPFGTDAVRIRPVRNIGDRLKLARHIAKDAADGPRHIIVAPSGMLETGSSILEYLVSGMENPANRIIFVNYQPGGGLGRAIQSTAPGGIIRVPFVDRKTGSIRSQKAVLRASVEKRQFTAHAGANEIEAYMGAVRARPGGVALVHGEPSSMDALVARPGVARFRPSRPANGDETSTLPAPMIRSLVRYARMVWTPLRALPQPTVHRTHDRVLAFTVGDPVSIAFVEPIGDGGPKLKAVYASGERATVREDEIMDRLPYGALDDFSPDGVRRLVRNGVASLTEDQLISILGASERLTASGSWTLPQLFQAADLTAPLQQIGAAVLVLISPSTFAAAPEDGPGRYRRKPDSARTAAELALGATVGLPEALGEVSPLLPDMREGDLFWMRDQRGRGSLAMALEDEGAQRPGHLAPPVRMARLEPASGQARRMVEFTYSRTSDDAGARPVALLGSLRPDPARLSQFVETCLFAFPADARDLWLMTQAAGDDRFSWDELADRWLGPWDDAQNRRAGGLEPVFGLGERLTGALNAAGFAGVDPAIALRIVFALHAGAPSGYFQYLPRTESFQAVSVDLAVRQRLFGDPGDVERAVAVQAVPVGGTLYLTNPATIPLAGGQVLLAPANAAVRVVSKGGQMMRVEATVGDVTAQVDVRTKMLRIGPAAPVPAAAQSQLPPLKKGQVLLLRSGKGTDLAVVTQDEDEKTARGYRLRHRALVAPAAPGEARREVPALLNRSGPPSRDGFPLTVVGDLSLTGDDPSQALRELGSRLDIVAAGDSVTVWALARALQIKPPFTIAELADRVASPEGERLFGGRARAKRALNALAADAPDALALLDHEPDRELALIRLSLAHVLAAGAKNLTFLADGRMAAGPAEAWEGLTTHYRLPLGSRVLIKPGTNVTAPGPERVKFKTAPGTRATLLAKNGRYGVFDVEVEADRWERVVLNFQYVIPPSPDLEDSIDLPPGSNGPPSASQAGSIPFLERTFARAGVAPPIYRSLVAWIAEAPFAPGVSGFGIALLLSPYMSPPVSWMIGQTSAALLFLLSHGRRRTVGAWVVALAGIGLSIVALNQELTLPTAMRLSAALSIFHLAVNNLLSTPEEIAAVHYVDAVEQLRAGRSATRSIGRLMAIGDDLTGIDEILSPARTSGRSRELDRAAFQRAVDRETNRRWGRLLTGLERRAVLQEAMIAQDRDAVETGTAVTGARLMLVAESNLSDALERIAERRSSVPGKTHAPLVFAAATAGVATALMDASDDAPRVYVRSAPELFIGERSGWIVEIGVGTLEGWIRREASLRNATLEEIRLPPGMTVDPRGLRTSILRAVLFVLSAMDGASRDFSVRELERLDQEARLRLSHA